MLSRAAAAGIEKFVRQGGVVVAEARTAWNDEAGCCGEAVPGLGLERVFGCRERGTLGTDIITDQPVPCR
jgi:beta-galactosidase